MDMEIVFTASSSDSPLSHIPPKAPTFNPPSPLSFTLSTGNKMTKNVAIVNPNNQTDMGSFTQVDWNMGTANVPNWLTLSKKNGTLQTYNKSGYQDTISVTVDASSLNKGNHSFTLSFTLNFRNEPPGQPANLTVQVTVS